MESQRQFISEFINDSRPKFNKALFERNEDETVNELMNVIYPCERNNKFFSIKVESYRVVEDYEEINDILCKYYNDLTKNKSKSKKSDNQYEYINLNESCIRLLIVRYYIKDRTDDDHLEVIIAIPRIIDKYYFKINGIMRSTLFQIVDGSTYNNGTSNAKVPSITLKIIFMALRITRYFSVLTTVDGEELKLTYYHSRVFNKGVAAAKYIFAKYGYYGAMEFLGLENSIYITRVDPKNPDFYTFAISDNIFISSPKFLLSRNVLLQSVLVTLYNNIVPGINFEEIFNREYWVRSLGVEFAGGGQDRLLSIYSGEDESGDDVLDKGYSILDSFEYIYDIGTRESIKLPDSEKETTYHIVRWIMREFNSLRLKDNLDIGYKKIRFAEYIASLYAFKIAKGIYRISDMNKKINIASIRKAIRTDPNYLLMAISKSNMVSYRNMVSDMDSMQALKFTYKGVSGLGEKSNKSIPEIYRSIHPSHITRVDLDASSDGNPGITGSICPYANIYDGFFEDYQEPNAWQSEFLSTMDSYKDISNIKDALVFDRDVNGIDNHEEIEVANEIIASMQQIIKPMIFADQGEVFIPEVL